jgi:hypothetical protein
MSVPDGDTRLERWYRRLLFAYPAGFRRERSDEVVSTLLSAAKPGRRAPSILDVVDLVVNGLRTRVRATRRTLAAPQTAEASRHAGLVILAVATAAAVALAVAVTVFGRPMFDPGRNLNRTYPLAARLGLAAVLATFPAALAAALADRTRIARRLAIAGGAGSIGFAAWLVAYALRTSNESLEMSNLLGLVTLLCLPAVLLRGADQPATHHRGDIRPVVALTALLTAVLVAGLQAEGAVHDTGLTQSIVGVLAVLAAWHLLHAVFHPELRRDESHGLSLAWTRAPSPAPSHLAVVWAVAIPVWGYAVGTFATPMFFRPELLALPGAGRLADVGPHALELGFASAVVIGLAGVTLGALRRVA